ncbi:ATP-binding protein [Streptomyces turgidiscabies]|uniref:ATP-binding protein n=1 Tax=Streptomyces turgidiscabies TaxID=85558 RepID=UPI00358F0B4C
MLLPEPPVPCETTTSGTGAACGWLGSHRYRRTGRGRAGSRRSLRDSSNRTRISGCSCPAAARHQVRSAAAAWGLPPETLDDLESIIGELVANALEHSDSRTITVACALTADTLTVSVTDEGNGCVPAVHVPVGQQGPQQESGRGLLIADALAARWGMRRSAAGWRSGPR